MSTSSLHGRTLVAEVADDGAGGACATRGTGLQGLQARVEALGGRLAVDSPPGDGTTLTATIPLAPWRTATEPFLEFGHDGDGGTRAAQDRGAARPARARPASRSPASGSSRAARRGSASACRSSTTPGAATASSRSCASRCMPFGEIDAATVDPGARASADWHAGARAQAYDECREEIAALLGEPDWRLTDAEPMVILTYRSVPAAEISGSIL